MNDGQLSQEEIDALLGNSGKNEPEKKTAEAQKPQQDPDPAQSKNNEEVADRNTVMSDLEGDVLGEIGNISFGSAATALSTILNQKVEITTPSVRVVKRNALADEFPVPHVSVNVNYTKGFQGSCLLVIKSSDASVIANLMMGGDGTHPSNEISEMEMSAVQEAMNQMMGSSSTAMSTVFNRRIDISPPQLTLMDVKTRRGIEHIPKDQVMFEVSFKLRIGNLVNSNIMQLMPVKFGKELVEVLMHATSDGDRVPPADSDSVQTTAPDVVSEPAEEPETGGKPLASGTGESHPQAAATKESDAVSNNIVSQAHVQPAEFSSFGAAPEQENSKGKEPRNLDLLMDIPLDVSVELGHTRKTVREVLELGPGSIIELDKLAGEAIDILINKKYVAKGEVVVVDENFGIRITEILDHADRLKSL
ncbi:flagellar motor switch phosphatase FliY [Sporolactobacillus vineae]|uniref:flagellar motor switch phosphatase FliY n=1 Tax=Sporolactobacillus vineae TaxID=444463 RepID=UPI000289CC50|nr:flagellar motor switch phosphatase FliY [Sporolactobacillus vineae]